MSQSDYIRIILEHFNLDKAKVVSTLLFVNPWLSWKDYSIFDPEGELMKSEPYTLDVFTNNTLY